MVKQDRDGNDALRGMTFSKRTKEEAEKELADTAEWRRRFWRAAYNPILDGYQNPEEANA